MAAANAINPTPEILAETLALPNSRPATSEHSAFQGRLVFHTRYSTLGDQARVQELYVGMKTANNLTDPRMQDYAADFAAWLVVTPAITFWRWDDHPELAELRRFWRGWLDASAGDLIDYVALWTARLEMGWSVADEWKRGYDKSHAVSLRAPRVLLPDEQLTDKERADPQPESVGSKQEKRSDAD